MSNSKKRLCERAGLKALAVATASVLMFIFFISAVLTVICIQNNVYFEDNHETFLKNVTENVSDRIALDNSRHFMGRIYSLADEGIIRYDGEKLIYDREEVDKCLKDFLPENSNYIFNLSTQDGTVVFSTLEGYDGGSVEGYYQSDAGFTSGSVTFLGAQPQPYEKTFYYGGDRDGFIDRIWGILDQEGVYNGTFYGTILHYNSDNSITSDYEVIATADDIDTYNVELNGLEYADSYDVFEMIVDTYCNNYEYYAIDDRGAGYYFPIVHAESEEEAVQNADRAQSADMAKNGLAVTIARGDSDSIRLLTDDGSLLAPVDIALKFEGEFTPTSEVLLAVSLCVSDNPTVNDKVYAATKVVDIVAKYSRLYPITLAVSAIAMAVILIWLCCASGHRSGSDKPSPIWFDKIPFELFIAAGVVAANFLYEGYLYCAYDIWRGGLRIFTIAAAAAILLAVFVFIPLTLMTLATRIKTGTFWKYCFVGMIFRAMLAVLKFIKRAFCSVRLTWKIPLLMAAVFAAEIFALALSDLGRIYFISVLLLGAIHFLLTCFLMIWAEGFARIKDYAKKVSEGSLDTKIDRNFLFGDLRKTADCLEGVGEGVKKAVDERMKSERLKTELITNVSHDLKTPLTSIVNYIDILSKDEIESETAREHVEVLKRHAQRMKKLIEDLVDVSKASSGSVSVNLERTDVNLLLTQTVAEYSQKLETSKLEPIVAIPEKKLIANLDGRHMWRVLDNLMNNICKYALPNTRVYIAVEESGPMINVSFKNISRYPLETSGDELVERFVRGDTSRNTEGSGLGLSIAKSLCDLQNVGFIITVDGDLFKAELTIPKSGDGEILSDEPAEDITEESSENNEQ